MSSTAVPVSFHKHQIAEPVGVLAIRISRMTYRKEKMKNTTKRSEKGTNRIMPKTIANGDENKCSQ